MKKPSKRLALAAVLVAVLASRAADVVPVAKLEQACAALQSNPLDAAGLQTLLDVSRQADYDPALRGRAMSAYALTLLLLGDTNRFESAAQAIRGAFPGAPPLITVTRDAAFAPCEACEGRGVQTTICPICRGLGRCRSCDATGLKEGAACPACKGKGVCVRCGGKKRLEAVCATCRGTCRVFKPSPAIRANFDAILAGAAALIQENARYAEAYRLASREPDSAKRIAALTALVSAYPHRPDLGPAKRLLEDSVNTRHALEAAARAKEAREREVREVEGLRALRDSKDLNGSISALSAYLQQHPKSSAQYELRTLLDELLARRARAALTRKLVIGALSAAALLFLAACLRPLLFRRKLEGSGPLPGMDKIDMGAFTDPLTLTARESKARVKTRTSKIALEDEAP